MDKKSALLLSGSVGLQEDRRGKYRTSVPSEGLTFSIEVMGFCVDNVLQGRTILECSHGNIPPFGIFSKDKPLHMKERNIAMVIGFGKT